MSVVFPLGPVLNGRRIVLASGSPRRRELLGMLGIAFDIVPADVDEMPRPKEEPAGMVIRLAVAKVEAVATGQPHGTIVIGADTTVAIDGEIIGKPTDAADAGRMLRLLSGRTHHVHTAVAVGVAGGAVAHVNTCTDVTFVEMGDPEIDWYIATGEPMDKAGAYGLQGAGAIFVQSVTGSVSGVLGLPLDVATNLLATLPTPGAA